MPLLCYSIQVVKPKTFSLGLLAVIAALGLLAASAFAGYYQNKDFSDRNVYPTFSTTVRAGEIKSIRHFNYGVRTPNCGLGAIQGYFPAIKVHSGRFHGSYTDGGVSASVSGHFFDHNQKAKGTVSASIVYKYNPYLGGNTCASGPVSWSVQLFHSPK